MDTYNILHLSDLHIGEGNNQFDSDRLLNALGDKLEQEEIHVVIFTGDIFHIPPVIGDEKTGLIDTEKKEKLIETAVRFFKGLLNYLSNRNCNLTKEDFWFVPGNHDLYSQDCNDTWSLFDGFLQKFYGSSKLTQYNDKHMILKIDSNHHKVLLGFNSNIAGNDDKKYFVGHITDDQLRTANTFIIENPEHQNYDKIAFFHHPCNLFEERERSNFDGIMDNSLEVSKYLAKWNVKIALHGHKHWAKPSIKRPLAGQKMYMFAGGSIGRLRDICSGYIIKIDNVSKEIRLKEIMSKNNNEFNIKTTNIPDIYIERLLLDEIEWKDFKSDEQYVLELIDKIYLSYEQLNLLMYKQENKDFLQYSIKHKLGFEINTELFGNNRDIWNDVIEILKKWEIPYNVKNSLQEDLMRRRYVAYALLGAFFTELYLNIRGINSIIWSETIKEFNLGTCSYYIYLKLRTDANGDEVQKSLDDIMDQFQDKLYVLQDFLYCIKLDIRNIFLELLDANGQKRHCSFDASVSRLIQLLTGTNIYCHEYSFARELIQNAIDAVSFYEKQSISNKLDIPISIELKCTDEEENYFRIRDYGIGMKREIIERYFTTLGRSYYKEYTERRNIKYNSVSNFGIGFLSVFKPCEKIIIKTRHYLEGEYYELEINSDRGHYTITSKSEKDFRHGTEITCYFRERNVDAQKIISYIRKIMLDIKYNIKIKCNEYNVSKIEARKIRRDEKNVIFIPFEEDRNHVTELSSADGEEWEKILKDALKDEEEKYRHGIVISTQKEENSGVDILSAGILLKNARWQDVFGKKIGNGSEELELKHIKVTMNFPPNWLNIDMSREKVNGICIEHLENVSEFKEKICEELKRQIWKVFKEIKNIPLVFFKEACMLVEALERSNRGSEEYGECAWNLKLCFEEKKIKYYLNYENEKNTFNPFFFRWTLRILPEYNEKNIYRRNHDTIKLLYEELKCSEILSVFHLFQKETEAIKVKEVLHKIGLDAYDVDNQYLPLVLAVLFNDEQTQDNDDEKKKLRQFLETTAWESCTVNQVEKSNGLFSVSYDDLEQKKRTSDSDKLKDRVDILIRNYKGATLDQRNGTNYHDFVWNYIILNTLEKCGLAFKECDVQKSLQKKYENLRDAIKILYFKEDESLLDVYTFASCYMSVLMEIPKENLDGGDIKKDAKYRWIFRVGLGLLYMWILTGGESSESDTSAKERSKRLLELYKQRKLDDILDNNIEKRNIQLLEAQENKSFDVLCFAELLYWVDNCIKQRIDLINPNA